MISGGQTGVDRAALDAAIEAGIPFAGWCPKGGWAEDRPEPPGVMAHYPHLRETPDASPGQRTEWNVRDSDALMVLVSGAGLAVSKGTSLAVACAKDLGRPHIAIDIDAKDALDQARTFLGAHKVSRLCIGGPRESEAPGIYATAHAFLTALLR